MFQAEETATAEASKWDWAYSMTARRLMWPRRSGREREEKGWEEARWCKHLAGNG